MKLRRGRKPTSTPQDSQPTRLPPHLLARLDAYAAQLQRQLPGMNVSRASALRTLLDKALTAEGV